MSRERAQEWLCSKLGIDFPYVSMGRVDSFNLFDANELIIFALYANSKDRYKRALDLGANLGLHSILMSKLGWTVKAYEPDPEIYRMMDTNFQKNGCDDVERHCAAVSSYNGLARFTRLLDNRTGSYIEESKEGYGQMEKFPVACIDCRPLFDWADFAKIDVEGHEDVLLHSVSEEHMDHLDLFCEVRGMGTAARVLRHFNNLGAKIYTQKRNWERAIHLQDMPIGHQEGSIFITCGDPPCNFQAIDR
jgi:FkbM family methyltransferase